MSDAYDALVEAAAEVTANARAARPNDNWVVRVEVERSLDAVLSARLQQPCTRCGGFPYKEPCPICHGAGTVPGPLALVSVLIERGVLEEYDVVCPVSSYSVDRGMGSPLGQHYHEDTGHCDGPLESVYRVVPTEQETR